MKSTVYLGLDMHARHCVLGSTDSKGNHLGKTRFATTEAQLISHVKEVNARCKRLSLEEGPMAYWASQLLAPYVQEILICDPLENKLISHDPHKGDERDAYALCRLHRLGELKRVYQPQSDERAVFKAAVQNYLALVAEQTAIKLQIKAKYRGWGVPQTGGQSIYGKKGREEFLRLIKPVAVIHQLRRLYALMDACQAASRDAFKEASDLAKHYPEIQEFMKMPGIGPVGAVVFDAFVQAPERFATKSRLWRYSRLSITDRSSDGKPLGYKRLERRGVSDLKSLSYRAWETATALTRDNEVKAFFERSLRQTGSRTHARLNTQRKILEVLWTIWRRKEAYDKEKFS